MATRKSPDILPKKDSSVADDTDLRDFRLNKGDYNRYLRMCFLGKADAVEQLRLTSKRHLDRLKRKTALSKAVTSPPEASEHTNLQSLYRWMESLNKSHRKAIDQLIVLHATACRRLGGK